MNGEAQTIGPVPVPVNEIERQRAWLRSNVMSMITARTDIDADRKYGEILMVQQVHATLGAMLRLVAEAHTAAQAKKDPTDTARGAVQTEIEPSDPPTMDGGQQ